MIVSHPGTWQRILQRNLQAYSFVIVDDVVSGSLSALQVAKENPPDLLIIDSSISFDDAIALVKNVSAENPATQSLVITDTTQQRRRIVKSGANYTATSYNFESQIDAILHQLKETMLDEIEASESSLKLDPGKIN